MASSSSVLPKSATGFTDPAYWKNFFAQRKSPFEWYGDYESLSDIFENYIKPDDRFLQIGCGNSELASQMYDNGFRRIHSIDVEASVIDDQKRRNKERLELIFEQGDATKLSNSDESYSVVVDKGTLDALLPPNATDEEQARVKKMFLEVERVLEKCGRYLIVTLAQPHIIDFWAEHFFAKRQYILRAHKVENKANGFAMPVFVLLATKLRMPMPMDVPVEMFRSTVAKHNMERMKTTQELKEAILAEQELSQFIHLCSKKLDAEISIDFYGESKSRGSRYRLCVVDDPKCTKLKSFATFIVPIGRDAEWMFASPKGRLALRAQCKQDRVVVCFLNRQHEYEGLEQVKSEIGHFIGLLDARIPQIGSYDLLSVGSVDVKTTIATGRSAINGDWAVEEVHLSDKVSRRLVFLSTMNLVQSEAFVKVSKKNKRIVDFEFLACEFHTMMIAALSLSPLQILARNEVTFKAAVLGLGGGILTAFIVKTFKKSTVTGVELDPDVVKIATDHFSLPNTDPRLDVQCMDALEYIKNMKDVDEADKLDVLFVDVAGTQNSALQCPPPVFLTDEALSNMSGCLKKDGLLSLNLVTRDNEIGTEVKKNVAKQFAALYSISSSEDVNEVLIGMKTSLTKDPVPAKLIKQLRTDFSNYTDIRQSIGRLRKV